MQFPTLDEFIRRAQGNYGCRFEPNSVTLLGPDGESRVAWLSRGENGDRQIAILPRISGDERLTPHVLRSLCARLGIPVADFEFDLSEDGLIFGDDAH